MFTFIRPALIAIFVALLCLAWNGRATAAAMPEEQLLELYLGIVEDAVATFEPIWKDDGERVPGGGFYDFNEYGNWRDAPYAGIIDVPGNGMIVFCYAVLLTQTDKETFTDQAVPRSVLMDRVTKMLRWLALTNTHAETKYPYVAYAAGPYVKGEQWTRPRAYRADMQGWLTVGAALLWERLEPELQKQLETALVGESLVDYEAFTWREREGGLHDCVKHYLSSITAAAFLFPEREEGVQAMDYVRQCGIDIVATWHDRARNATAEGKPVRDWVKSWNLYQDYSSDHHAHSQIWYGCDLIFEGRTYVELLSHITGIPVPETYTYEGNGFDGVLDWVKRITLPEGEPAPVHGAEYDSYYGAGLLAYCYGAVIRKDPVAAALEEQAARLLRRQSRAVKQYDYHRNSWAKAAAAYLMHRYCGPRAEPAPMDEALQKLEGVYHHRSQLDLVHRGPDKWVSWSWGILPGTHVDGHCGLVVPVPGGDEPLVYVHANSMVGRIRGDWLAVPKGQSPSPAYTCVMKDNGFHTAGVREAPGLDQYRAFFSFPEGPCVLFTRFKARKAGSFTWTGLPVYFYVRDGMSAARTLYDAEGEWPLEKPCEHNSTWWCVDDRLGLVAVGGNARLELERVPGLNWARVPEYRDQCDVVSVAPVEDRPTEEGDAPVNLAVAVFANTAHEQIAQVAGNIQADLLELPEGWQGLVVPDAEIAGKRYLALANLEGGQAEVAIDLAFAEGAPILGRYTHVRGLSGRVVIELEPRESDMHVIELYASVTGDGEAAATRQAANLYIVKPLGEAVEVKFTYAGRGEPRFLTRLAGGAVLDEPTGHRPDENGSFVLRIGAPTLLEVVSEDREDRTGAAVEIAGVDMLPDGRATVKVVAGDQSGINNVRLYLDGQLVSEKARASYEWTLRPGAGFHTFHAVATDASPNRNPRTSFQRTVEIKVGRPAF